jgi:hypothetical protein
MEQLIYLLPLDTPVHNGTIYPSSVIEDACREFEERIKKRGGMLGECSIPPDINWDEDVPIPERYMNIDLARASHIVRHAWVENGSLNCKVQLLSKYAEISDLLNIDYLGVPRSTGSIEAGSNVCTAYTLITVDLAMPELI